MPKPSWSGDVSRRIVRRIVVEGDLVLQTPAHFGNGDGDNQVDMPLLTDPLDNKTPLLTGASIAGALRSYLRERELGFRAKIDTEADRDADRPRWASILLFGGHKGDDEGEQSPLIVEDTRGKDAAIELRDGVRLAGESRTSAKDALFTIEMWEAGTTFPLRFELVVRQRDDVMLPSLKQALATALAGFSDGSITIGARKRRGYGQVSVTGWRIKEYDLTDTAQLLDWIENGAKPLSVPASSDIVQASGVAELITDRRQAFRLKAEFLLDGSLLIRSGSGPDIEQASGDEAEIQRPDTMHLHSRRPASSPGGKRERRPVLPGTSLTGALRARAFKIACLIAPPTAEGKEAARRLIEAMFGADMNTAKKPVGSRMHVYEQEVSGIENMSVQNRVSIDRFTGGTRDGALFNEQPLFGGAQSVVTVDLQLENPQEYEIGLLLLLLKDLWTRDLPLGGEISVGRGRLCGKSCDLEYQNGQKQTWKLIANGVNGLKVEQGNPEHLEHYVVDLHTYLSRSKS
jgi:CRISPR/Cas system CSM-associated protein Csm3 (group 7 of RAMP superfamily)